MVLDISVNEMPEDLKYSAHKENKSKNVFFRQVIFKIYAPRTVPDL